MNWLKPAALRPRREAERDLFRHGRYPSGTLPVWTVDAAERVDFSKPLRWLTEPEALALLRPAATPVPRPAPASVPGRVSPSLLARFWSALTVAFRWS
jgi:lysozyme